MRANMYLGRFVATGTVAAVIIVAVIIGVSSAGADDNAMSLAPAAVQSVGSNDAPTPPLTDEQKLANVPLLGGPDPAKGDIGLRTWEPVPPPPQVADLRGLRVDECCAVGSFAQPIDNTVNFYNGNVIGVYPDSIDGDSVTLKNFSVELEFTGSVQFTYTVYHKDRDLPGSQWRPVKVVKKTHVGTGRNFYDSGNLNVELPLDMVAGQPAIAFYALGIGWGNTPVTYGRSRDETLPDPFCVGSIQGYWGLDRLPPEPTNPDDPLTLPSPLYTRGALSMDICFAGPPAACCLPDDTCVNVDQPNECELQGGQFTRGGVQCPAAGQPPLCPLPEGACCYNGEVCNYTTEYDCEDNLGGLWQEGRDCAPFNPCSGEAGACCMADGSCVDSMLQLDCENLDGVYVGDSSLCADPSLTCVPRGACCYSGGGCDVVPENQCQDPGEVYSGDGIHCQKAGFFPYDPCDNTVGACCLYDGSCEITTEYDCWDNPTGTAGNWTAGADCNAADCDQNVLGACCNGTTCTGDTTVESCLGCVDADAQGNCPGGMDFSTSGPCPDTGNPGECVNTGIDWFEGQPCEYGPCLSEGDIGPCCVLGECQVTTPLECQVLGGTYGGDAGDQGFEACSINGYPENCTTIGVSGACCLTNASGDPICKLLSSAECATSNGWFAGQGVPCSSLVCAIGNCCDVQDQCTETRRLDCPNKTDWVAGQRCSTGPYSPNPCKPIGACCFYEGTCDILNEDQCINLGGIYQGDNENAECTPGLCPPPPTGACCYNDTSCTITDPLDCSDTGGTYQGDDTQCTPGLCPAIGACCIEIVPGLYSCDVREKSDCLAQPSSTFAGAGTDCITNGCDSGACCELDGTCTNGLRAACEINTNGEFLVGEMCSTNSCPPRGACCMDTGGVPTCDEVTEADCTSNGGYFQGLGVPCGGSVCTAVACCVPDEGCKDLLPEVCASTNGVSGEPGQICSSGTLCTPGACCLNTGGASDICVASLNALECQSSQFAVPNGFKGAGVPCTPGICEPDVACCLTDGSCRDMSPGLCTNSNGVPAVNGQLCAEGDLCSNGACCQDLGGAANVCSETMNQLECEASAGYLSFQGPGSSCVPDPCNVGICCRLNGTCEDNGGAGYTECSQWGGAEYFPGESCVTHTCVDKCASFPGTAPGDFDNSGFIDLADFAAFQRCFGDAPSDECMCIFDTDENGVIDITDFQAFEALVTGPAMARGGCCHLDGTCQDNGGAGVLSADCAQFGGATFYADQDCGALSCVDQCASFPGTPPWDFDSSGTIDLKDFGNLQVCFGLTPSTECMCIFDGNENGAIDLADFVEFRNNITGPS